MAQWGGPRGGIALARGAGRRRCVDRGHAARGGAGACPTGSIPRLAALRARLTHWRRAAYGRQSVPGGPGRRGYVGGQRPSVIARLVRQWRILTELRRRRFGATVRELVRETGA